MDSSLFDYKKIITPLLTLLIAFTTSGCLSEGSGSFGDLLSSESDVDGVVTIVDQTPTVVPTVTATTGDTTFAVSIASGAGNNVKYRWVLDGSEVANSSRAFYTLSAAALTAGSHSLAVTAFNSVSSDTYTYTIDKNSPPTLSSPSPAVTGTSVTCGSGSVNLSIVASDLESQNLSYTWKVNGVSGSSFFSGHTFNNSGSSITFTPNCTLTGLTTISVEVNDGYDTTVISPAWNISIINSGVASIDAITPNSSPYVIIPSTSFKTFTMVNPTGLPPVTYSWSLEGTPIPGELSTSLNLYASTLDPMAGLGPYTLSATVSDGTSASDTVEVEVLLNKPPTLSGQSPSQTTLTKNYASPNLTFSVTGSDPNSDSIRYIWTINGVAYEPPYSGLPSHISINGASPNQLIFNPDVNLLGTHTIAVRAREDRATDFEYSNTINWELNLNRFSNECNSLQAGQICTLIGMPGLSSDENSNGRLDAGVDKFKIRPNQIFPHSVENLDASSIQNFFISDTANHMVWYYNRSNKTQTVLGLTVQPYEVKPLIGNGASGKSPDSNATYSYQNYKLSYPEYMYFNSANNQLYIADRGNHRIVRISDNGQGLTILGTGSNTGSDTTDALATTHRCYAPSGLVYSSARNKLYVACTYNHAIKEISITSFTTPATWTAKVYAGVVGTAGTTTGAIATANFNWPWALALDGDDNIYVGQVNGNCRIRVINTTGSSITRYAISIPSGHVQSIIGAGNCTANTNGTNIYPNTTVNATNNIEIAPPKGLAIDYSGSTVNGIYFTSFSGNRTFYANNAASSRTIGNMAVGSNEVRSIWGAGSSTGNDGFTGNAKPASNNTTFNPVGILLSQNKIFIAEPSNHRIRELDVTVGTDNGNIATTLYGLETKHDSSPDTGADAPDYRGYFITSLAYDSTSNSLFFGDVSARNLHSNTHTPPSRSIDNNRVRRLDLSSGYVNTLIGQGYSTYQDQQSPLNVFFQGIRSIVPTANSIFVLDRNWTGGGTRSCYVLAYNRTNIDSSTFGFVGAGKVGMLAGNYTLGCGSAAGLGGNALDASVRMEPFDMAYSNTATPYILLTQFKDHCILKLDSSGNLTNFSGLCGTAGNAEGLINAASIRYRYPLAIIADPRNPGNFFLMDQTDGTGTGESRIKYINNLASDIEFGGITIPANNVKSLITVNDGYGIGLAYFKDTTSIDNDRICYTSGSGINTTLGITMENGDGQLGRHRVICHLISTLSQEMQIGSDDSNIRGGSPLAREHEGLSYEGTVIKKIKTPLYTPYGLTFDPEGNLYISERDAHVVRKVKRWW